MNLRKLLCKAVGIAILLASNTLATEPDPINLTRIFDVSIEDARSSWTTAEGMQRFFAAKAIVDPRVDGEYSYANGPLDWDNLLKHRWNEVGPDDI